MRSSSRDESPAPSSPPPALSGIVGLLGASCPAGGRLPQPSHGSESSLRASGFQSSSTSRLPFTPQHRDCGPPHGQRDSKGLLEPEIDRNRVPSFEVRYLRPETNAKVNFLEEAKREAAAENRILVLKGAVVTSPGTRRSFVHVLY